MYNDKKCYLCGTSDNLVFEKDCGVKIRNSVVLCESCTERTDNMSYGCPMRSGVEGDGCTERGIVKSNRTFGVELECLAPTRKTRKVAQIKLSDKNGMSTDGSIRTGEHTQSCEVTVKPMLGIVGEQHLIETCKVLQSLNFSVNPSCGTHVHIGIPEGRERGANKTVEEKLKTLFYMYVMFEPVIRCLVPRARSIGNTYCRPLRPNDDFGYTRIDSETKKPAGVFAHKEFSKYYEQGGAGTRYFGINFRALYEHGTLEIRYHEGTIDPVKLLHWIAFHSAIVDMVMDGKITEDEIAERGNIKQTKALFDNLIKLLGNRITEDTVINLRKRFVESDEYIIEAKQKRSIVPEEIDLDEYDEYNEYN